MTTRERLEARAERRRQWAEGRDAKAAAGFARAESIASGIPLGQPILVGHHSEKRHQRDLEKIDAGMRQGCESAKMATEHRGKANGIEDALASSIYSDDPDAIEALEAKAAELDAAGDREVAINKAWRKHAKPVQTGPNSWGLEVLSLAALSDAWTALGVRTQLAASMIERALEYSWLRSKGPCDPAYNRANARRARERIKIVRARQERTAVAEGMPDGVYVRRSPTPGDDWCTVTFAEKPPRTVIEALKAAGFHWGSGSWHGAITKLPASVEGS